MVQGMGVSSGGLHREKTQECVLRGRGGLPWEPLLLAVFVLAVFGYRLDTVPFRGEETRWARVAWEMRETGDYVVPRQQGQVFADRPPLNSWCMLAASAWTGRLDRFSVRIPAALATLLTTLLLYVYCRQFLSRGGAMTAGLVYATFPQTLQLGRFAESDALFTLLVSAALLTWHAGYERHWLRAATWTSGYALAALAGLAKGPQGPVYFAATVTVFLTLKRDWRFLFSLSHVVGLLTFAAVLGAWQIPFSLRAGSNATIAIWSEEGTFGSRLAGVLGTSWWRHAAVYPLEVFLHLLPWSVFLFWFLRPGSWRSRAAIDQHAAFLAVYLAIAFPTCWLTADARPRHLMAAYPAVACLIALAIDRSCFSRSWDRGFRWFLAVAGVLSILLGAGVAALGFSLATPRFNALVTPSAATAACGLAMCVLGAVGFWTRTGDAPARAAAGVGAVAATLGLGFVVLGIDHLARISDDLEPQVARLKSDVLRGQRLVSLGPLFHRFTFYYRDPIEIVPWPEDASAAPSDYFCFMKNEAARHGKTPWTWQEVAVLYCDRTGQEGANVVHVCRRR